MEHELTETELKRIKHNGVLFLGDHLVVPYGHNVKSDKLACAYSFNTIQRLENGQTIRWEGDGRELEIYYEE